MGLFDGLLLEPESPNTSRQVAKTAEIPYIVTIKRASNGEEILLCNITPPPAGAIAEARQRKLPLFTLAEIEPMRRLAAADTGALDTMIKARRLMGWGGPSTFEAAA